MDINNLKFDEKGLITAVVVDYYTKKVLTVAYMNRESLEISIKEKKTCFFSRSRQELWRKGETSGNVQHIVSIVADCDGDALTIEVKKEGPACHLGTDSCFNKYLFVDEDSKVFSFEKLYELITSRKVDMTEKSYTSYLFQNGIDKILKKMGEECTEVIIGAKGGDQKETVYELADLLYHSFVLMVEMGIKIDDVVDELAKRQVLDTKVKQMKMV